LQLSIFTPGKHIFPDMALPLILPKPSRTAGIVQKNAISAGFWFIHGFTLLVHGVNDNSHTGIGARGA
jgi:hypothetical protein